MLPLFNSAIYASAAINNYNNVAAAAAQVLYDDRERAAVAPRSRRLAKKRRCGARLALSLARVPLDIPVNLCQGET